MVIFSFTPITGTKEGSIVDNTCLWRQKYRVGFSAAVDKISIPEHASFTEFGGMTVKSKTAIEESLSVQDEEHFHNHMMLYKGSSCKIKWTVSNNGLIW